MDRDLQMDWYFEFSFSNLSSMSYFVSLDLLQSQFDQPIAEAAKYFGVCQSLFKRICRQHGIKKWPQRTIRSLKRHIEVLNEQLKTTRDSRKREKIVAEIHAQQSRIDANYTKQLRFDPRISSMSYSKQHRYFISLDRLQSQFEQPIAEAAKYFGVRQSLFNRICRQHGMKNNMEFDNLMAASNPALEAWKGGKKTKGSFIPGKGMKNNMEFDNLVAGLENPAQAAWGSRKKTKSSFIPGKGLRDSMEFDNLVAGLENPAQAAWGSRKKTKSSFIPGKGLRDSVEFENLVAGLENPAQAAWGSRKKTKSSFIPGKGLRNNMEFENLVAGLENPAQAAWGSRKRTKGSFIPGKGMRNNIEFDNLMG